MIKSGLVVLGELVAGTPDFSLESTPSGRRLMLPPPKLVRFKELDRASSDGLDRLDALLKTPAARRRAETFFAEATHSANRDSIASLAGAYRHRLHNEFDSLGPTTSLLPWIDRHQRTSIELALVNAHWMTVNDCLRQRDRDGLCDLLTGFNAALGEAGQLRTMEVGNAADEYGSSIMFSPASDLHKQLPILFDSLCEASLESPGFAYTQALSCIGHLHPFADGNGRTARIMASCILSSTIGEPSYIPTGALAHDNLATWLLSIREAAYFADYAALSDLLFATLSHCIDITGAELA